MAAGQVRREAEVAETRLSEIIHRLEAWPVGVHFVLTLIMLAVIASVDVMTPRDLSFSVFYFVPVLWATWFTGRYTSFAVAVLASLIWGFADLAAGITAGNPSIAMWNEAIRLALFLGAWSLLAGVRDISEARRALALTDPLTGVANMRVLNDRLEHEIEVLRRYGTPFALAYMDLDEFKSINDKLGHRAGDEVLKSVADYLVSDARAVDTIARLGGDEFAVLMPQTDESAASIVLQRTEKGLLEVIHEGAPDVEGVGASVGAVVFTGPPHSVDQALGLADELMYNAKRSGGGSVMLSVHDRDQETQ